MGEDAMTTKPETIVIERGSEECRCWYATWSDDLLTDDPNGGYIKCSHGSTVREADAADAARVLGVSRDDLIIAAKVLAHLGWYGLPKAFGITTEVECSAFAAVFTESARRVREAEAQEERP